MIQPVQDLQDVKRILNDELAAAAVALETDMLRTQLFYCECDDATCMGRVELPRQSFRELRRLRQPLQSPDCLGSVGY